MTDEELQFYIDTSKEFSDEKLLEEISITEAYLKHGKRIIPAGPTTEQIKTCIAMYRKEAERRGLKTS